MQDDNMLRVRPRGPESVASSVASGMSRTLSHHLGSDEEAEKSPVDQPSPSGTIETPGDPVETMEQGDEVEDSGETADPDATLTETQPGVQPEAEQDSERESDAPAEDEADESAEATEKRDDGKGAAARKKPTKVTVTDADVEAELEVSRNLFICHGYRTVVKYFPSSHIPGCRDQQPARASTGLAVFETARQGGRHSRSGDPD